MPIACEPSVTQQVRIALYITQWLLLTAGMLLDVHPLPCSTPGAVAIAFADCMLIQPAPLVS